MLCTVCLSKLNDDDDDGDIIDIRGAQMCALYGVRLRLSHSSVVWSSESVKRNSCDWSQRIIGDDNRSVIRHFT